MGPLYISEMADVTNFKYGVQLRGTENARLMMSSLKDQKCSTGKCETENARLENARPAKFRTWGPIFGTS